ncbi:DNA-binding transcriptional activator of the SARP family [Nonomuraea solani]|uniref:DNA-binding transcriptional activator of the SARP family n=1 Tax=Nonomuraea solani TaxID=1144553 RepID=A0A1H6EGU5_9ACTN|nr:BTAD domain-containing putative transcriptional regulator [Nonomuraea solani]SEG96034.1 DNA-binding transcriptional activator of the SARP family [Nonomuraea solani]
MALEIRFLGPWQVLAGDEPVRLAGQRRIGVLARLAMDAGQVVRTERVLTDIWEDSSAATMAKQLHIVISKLRETLGPHTTEEIIQTMPGGYRLALEPDQIDAHLFARLAKRARTAHAKGSRAAADALFRTALQLWRGEALAGLTSPWARIEATRLEEEHRTVLEDHADLRLAAGDHHAVATDLAAHVRAHPLRERPTAQLMLALHRAGRPAEALAVYQNTRKIMISELGIEPGTELRRLHQAVLVNDPALDLTTPAQQTTISQPYIPAELPADTHTFTARATEIDHLRTALGPNDGPAITVIDGPGGIGKSALAVHAAHAMATRFTDGVIYLNLHGSTPGLDPLTPAQALRHLLRSLGLDGTAVPADPGEAAVRYRSLTATGHLLVILDNARDARQIRPLIPAGPGCRVLITSRDPLATLDNATHLHLGTLNTADAAALLSRLAGPDRVRTEPQAAERVVHLCGGFPLALRIVGARLAARPDWTLSDLADRLADATRRLDTLEYADLAVRASISVSHHHLREEPTGHDAAHLLPLLGLLDLPTHTPAATAALTGWPRHRAEAALERLQDARLLEPAGPDRYRLHDLAGLYARERAHQDLPEQERITAVRRALHHYLTTLWLASPMLGRDTLPRCPVELPDSPFKDLAEAERWIQDERDNLLAAAQQALAGPDPATAIGLAIGLHWPFCYQGWHTQLADVYAHAIEVADRIAAWEDKAQLRSLLGWVLRDQGRHDAAITQLETALTDWDRAGLPRRKAGALNNLAAIHTITGRLDDALGYLESAFMLNDDDERPVGSVVVRNNRVHVYYRQGRFDEAIEEARQVVKLWPKADPLAGSGTAQDSLGDAYRHAGRPAEAVESYIEAVRLLRESGYRLKEAVSRWWLGTTLHDLGRHGEAREQWEESVHLLRDARLLTPQEATEILAQPVPETPQPIKNML